VEERQTVRAEVALGWRRQSHDAEPVVLLVECHHGDELVLVDDVSIENLQLPVAVRLDSWQTSDSKYRKVPQKYQDQSAMWTGFVVALTCAC
jgi:hypothetical protein